MDSLLDSSYSYYNSLDAQVLTFNQFYKKFNLKTAEDLCLLKRVDNSEPIHLSLLLSVFHSVTGESSWPNTVKEWEKIGLKSPDPFRVLNSDDGALTLMFILYYCKRNPEISYFHSGNNSDIQNIYLITRKIKHWIEDNKIVDVAEAFYLFAAMLEYRETYKIDPNRVMPEDEKEGNGDDSNTKKIEKAIKTYKKFYFRKKLKIN
jgi:ELMO/CED-12 family